MLLRYFDKIVDLTMNIKQKGRINKICCIANANNYILMYINN